MIRIAEYQAETAKKLLPVARDNRDAMVIQACVNIRQGWLLGRRVERADWELVELFADVGA